MTRPLDIIYDVIIEKFRGGTNPTRVFIKFDKNRNRHIIGAKNVLDNTDIPLRTTDTEQIEAAIEMLKWAVQNDPHPPAPEILEFLQSV